MEDFLEEQYSIILITARRAGVKNGDIPATAPKNCILFKKDEENDIWCAVIAFQVFLNSPSHLKF